MGLFNIPVVSLKSFDVPTATFASLEALSRVYSNEKIQKIIAIVVEARPAAINRPRKYFFKVCFLDIYRNNNYIACYNIC